MIVKHPSICKSNLKIRLKTFHWLGKYELLGYCWSWNLWRINQKNFDLMPPRKLELKLLRLVSNKNLIARAVHNSDITCFPPPLISTKKEVDDIVTRTTKALNSLVDQLTKEYSWKD